MSRGLMSRGLVDKLVCVNSLLLLAVLIVTTIVATLVLVLVVYSSELIAVIAVKGIA